MRKSISAGLAISLVSLSMLLPFSSPLYAATANERITSSVNVVREMSKEEDVGAMADLVKSAKGVVIIPNYVKAALGIGGAHGEGLILRHDSATNTWYGPNFLSITGASIGFQIGVQSTALLLVVTNQKGMDRFYGDKLKLGADVDIAAGPIGRSAGAATDVNLQASIYSYSVSKGLFAGLSLSGAMVTTDHDTNASYWGSSLNSKEILLKKASATGIQPLVSALNELIKQSGQ